MQISLHDFLAIVGVIVTVEIAMLGWILRESSRVTKVETWVEAIRAGAKTFEDRVTAQLDRIERKLDGKEDRKYGSQHNQK